MEISYEVKASKLKSVKGGCWASCCWRYGAGVQGQI